MNCLGWTFVRWKIVSNHKSQHIKEGSKQGTWRVGAGGGGGSCSRWLDPQPLCGLCPWVGLCGQVEQAQSCVQPLGLRHIKGEWWHLSITSFSPNFCCQLCLLFAQWCPTLCDPVDCGLPGSSVYGILQAKILEWVAIPFSRWSSLPRDWTWVSCITGRFFTVWAIREVTKALITKAVSFSWFIFSLKNYAT